MQAKRTWTLSSLFYCLLWNGILLGVLFYFGLRIVGVLHQWVDPFLKASTELPEEINLAVRNLNQFLADLTQYLAPALFGVGAIVTLLLWLSLVLHGRNLIGRAAKEALPVAREVKPKKVAKQPAPAETVAPEPPSSQPAVQMLSILQREGRFIDFLQEDLSLYEDAQIGAAVRSIHEGCKGALHEYVKMQPIFEEGEGSEVTVPKGFDARAIRLSGNVAGEPPFKGVLRHRGWRVTEVQLPQPTVEQKKEWVLAPAEVEIEG